MFARTNTTDGHWHVVRVDQVAGRGLSSADAKHRHEIMLRGGGGGAPGGMFRPQDWVIMPASDGHSHFLEDLTGGEEKPDEKATYEECLETFQAELDNEHDNLKEASEAEDFYFGKQWSESDKKKLEAEDRAVITINRCEALVDSLSGTMRQNRMDWKCRPMEEGDQTTADLATLVLKSIAIDNQLDAEETDICEDAIIGGRGGFNLTPSRDEFGRKKLLIEWFPRDDFFCGMHLRRDLRDCEDMSKARWYSPKKLRQEFPEFADEIPESWSGPEADQTAGNPREDKYAKLQNMEKNLWDIAGKKIRVVELWRKEFTKTAEVKDEFTGEVFPGPWSGAAARKVAQIPGTVVDWVPIVRMRQTIFTAGKVLQDGYPALPVGVTFPIHVSYGHKRKNRWWGKLQAAKDPQRNINKRESQLTDILSRMAGYGWYITRDMFDDDKEFESFKQNVSKAGWIAILLDPARRPIKEEGSKVPSEVIAGLTTSGESFNTVTAWSMAWIAGSGEMSGDSVAERQKNALLPNEFLFDNLRQCKVRLGKATLAWVQQEMTPDEIARLVMGSAEWERAKIGGQPATGFTREQIIGMLQNKDLTRYDVVVSDETWSPTTRMSNFRQWSKIPNVPLRALIEMSDIPNKDRMLEILTQQEQAQAQAEQAKSQMEIGKTLIAKGIDPNSMPQGGGPSGQPPA
jgi:hypothetical protein